MIVGPPCRSGLLFCSLGPGMLTRVDMYICRLAVSTMDSGLSTAQVSTVYAAVCVLAVEAGFVPGDVSGLGAATSTSSEHALPQLCDTDIRAFVLVELWCTCHPQTLHRSPLMLCSTTSMRWTTSALLKLQPSSPTRPRGGGDRSGNGRNR